MIAKAEMVTAVVELYDRMERAERAQRELLSRQLYEPRVEDSEGAAPTLSETDAAVLAYGRQKLLEKCTREWRRRVSLSDDGTPEPYGEWVGSYVDRIPDFMSRDGFMAYFDAELRATYEDEVEKALASVAGDDDE